ncbi:MAG: YkgJ family cysteine cluster protein [Proteobacteria bacterium]|nr:YkgJ family cysteine cluster protein [Pseudomonadota bacterium]MBU1585711.1 YkgJ family cysteine cluster protein [Pseudomonadota bacterium]MBU2452642.1 YkgJ family cysteine cluster protein [Pseudomonadota bacterium]MBU2629934.1 YkgJ family cysteine cluster protein [Pseudomonadota bacterium]
MDKNSIESVLENYTALVKRVDDHLLNIEKKYADKIVCKKGCDTCCRFLTLFPVEAVSISSAFGKLPEEIQTIIVNNLKNREDACPLLINRACALYSHRPIICRTHGYPIYMEKDGEPLVDFCPKNFNGITSFPKDALLSIEQLNTTLTTINRYFLDSIETDPPFPDRIPISGALFLEK